MTNFMPYFISECLPDFNSAVLRSEDQNSICFKNFKRDYIGLQKLCELEVSQSRSSNIWAKSQNNRRAASKEEGLPLKCKLRGTVRYFQSLKIITGNF